MENKILGEIITSGSELMLGSMVDSNSAWISESLAGVGINVVRHTSVGDDLPLLVQAYQRAWEEHQVVVATGGLGPTEDDLTRQAVSQAFGRELEYKEDLAAQLKDMFQRLNYPLTDNNFRQAWIPKGCIVVPNLKGTAPGFALVDEGRMMVFLPGVPSEMKHMVQEWVLPSLRQHFPNIHGVVKTVVLKTAGLGESAVDHLIHDLMGPSHNPSVGLLAAPDMVRVIVSGRAENEKQADELLQPTVAELGKRLSGHVFGYGDASLPQVVAQLLKAQGLKLTILDAATQGVLCGTLGGALDQNNWNGSQEFPDSCVCTSGGLVLEEGSDPDVVYLSLRVCSSLEALDNSNSPEGQRSITIESVVSGFRINGGEPLIREFRVGGEHQRILSRVSAFGIFHIWQSLVENSSK